MAVWDREEIELVKAIDATHPVLTGRHDIYEKAEALVRDRHSKSSMTDLVNFLLHTIERSSN